MTKAQALDKAVDDYLSSLSSAPPPALSDIEPKVLSLTYDEFDLHNAICQKDERWQKPHTLAPPQIGKLLLALRQIRVISLCDGQFDPDYSPLAVYQTDGKHTGTYTTSETAVKQLIREISPYLKGYDLADTLEWLRMNAPVVPRCADPDLIPVANGVFDYRQKALLPFSPDLVFLTKSPVAYKKDPPLAVLRNPDDGTDWDVESWMADLSDDPEIVLLFWQLIGAVIRPGVRWDKAAWLYSRSGNNGKGTLCSLMRSVAGPENCASISIEDFAGDKDFMLEPLIRSSAIIVDENNVGAYIDKSRDLKAVVTGDVIQINRKYKSPITYQFRGFMVQCLNDYPRIKDKTGSFARRQLIVPMEKCFTGAERKYIKSDYLKRPEVLEYVLHKVLHMDYNELSAPAACREVLEDYQESNDTLLQFVEDTFDQLQWSVVPFTFLYALYKSWVEKMNPSGIRSLPSARTFQDDLVALMETVDTGFVCPGGKRIKRRFPRGELYKPEPLIAAYNLTEWMNPVYKGDDPMKKCVPAPGMIPENIRGIRRFRPLNDPAFIDDDEDSDEPQDPVEHNGA